MAITVRQFKEKLAELPPELDDLEIVGLGQVEGGPQWSYELGPPWHYNVDPVVLLPILGIHQPLTQEKLAAIHPDFRPTFEAKIRKGEYPFEP